MSCRSEESKCCCCASLVNIGVALAALLVVGLLVWAMKHYTTPPSLLAERAALRKQNLAELRQTDAVTSTTYGWINAENGVIRLPLERAMELTVAAWQNPARAMIDLSNRVEQATYIPPPPPEEPSEFE